MIEISELTKYYGERKAVGPLSFTIEKGEVVGLLGLNGAGKTTTLRMLSSELLPTGGQMLIDGVDLVDEPEKVRPRIGYLPDRPPLYGEMTVSEYLNFAGKLRRLSGNRLNKRVNEVVELTGLGQHFDDIIDTLSHGYKQRVGIAQAIVHEPSLLLLDEPISGLDPVQIVEMRALIRSLRGEHTTVVSSHILSEISETCDRLLVIRDGEIVASGSEGALTKQIAHTKRFQVTVRVPSIGDYRDNPFEGVRKLVEGIDDVLSVTEGDAIIFDDKNVVAADISGKQDVREETCRVLVEAGFGIRAVESSGKDLENVFLELTGKGGA
jgi:ABC-2 type transport system ATP-binding protein